MSGFNINTACLPDIEMSETKENFKIINNTILPDFRFAKHDNKEFHVFSGELTNPSKCQGDWIAINSDKKISILTDNKTMQRLKNKKIHWNINDDGVLFSAKIYL
jgi:hypothetical protein